jgi:hypothetical protein
VDVTVEGPVGLRVPGLEPGLPLEDADDVDDVVVEGTPVRALGVREGDRRLVGVEADLQAAGVGGLADVVVDPDVDLAEASTERLDDASPLLHPLGADGVAQHVATFGLVQGLVPGLPGTAGDEEDVVAHRASPRVLP